MTDPRCGPIRLTEHVEDEVQLILRNPNARICYTKLEFHRARLD